MQVTGGAPADLTGPITLCGRSGVAAIFEAIKFDCTDPKNDWGWKFLAQ
jgi:hypothetical protein